MHYHDQIVIKSKPTFGALRSAVGGHVTVAVECIKAVVADTAVLTDARQTRCRQICVTQRRQ